MKRPAFTLVELLIVIVIVGILASVGIPHYQGSIIKSKLAELFNTVAAIHKAEDTYFYEHNDYALLDYSWDQAKINAFETTLGLRIPGMDSIFVYGVYYDPASIYVRARSIPNTWFCFLIIEGSNKGVWKKNAGHPWSKYLPSFVATF